MTEAQLPPPARDDDDQPARDGAERLLRDLIRRAEAEGADPADLALARGRTILGASLLSLRSVRGLSQSELSVLSGVEQADISRIERAVVDPRASTLLRLLAGLAARITLELEEEPAEEQWHIQVKEQGGTVRRQVRAETAPSTQHNQVRRAGA